MGWKCIVYKSLLIPTCLLSSLSYYLLDLIKGTQFNSTENMTTSSTFFIISAYMVIFLLILEAQAMFLPKTGSTNYRTRERVFIEPDKRPFCNAFTGCGKKRSNLPPLADKGLTGEEVDESINSLLELSVEPAVADLSRQIMSEAKIWEAIQEANYELNRRKQQSSMESSEDDVAVPARTATASCPIPPCYV